MFSLRAKSLIWPAICGSIEHLVTFQVVSWRRRSRSGSRQVVDLKIGNGAPGEIAQGLRPLGLARARLAFAPLRRPPSPLRGAVVELPTSWFVDLRAFTETLILLANIAWRPLHLSRRSTTEHNQIRKSHARLK